MSDVSIEFRSVDKALGGRPVLSGLSLEVRAGDWTALLGPSGAGKTTILRLVAGLEKPDRGRILLYGCDAADMAPRDRGVGMVFQDLALWPYLTVRQHVAEVSRSDPRALLERVGLGGLESKRPHELSGGERQRLALARALARSPRVLLLDEPFSGLDPLLRRSLAETLAELQRERGFTVLYVSHFLESPVARASRVVLLREGRVEQEGPLSELRAAPRSEWVASFLSDEAEVRA
jgi:ABC-type Fe3+/spermidine/putrescine transport system ATPase subunit